MQMTANIHICKKTREINLANVKEGNTRNDEVNCTDCYLRWCCHRCCCHRRRCCCRCRCFRLENIKEGTKRRVEIECHNHWGGGGEEEEEDEGGKGMKKKYVLHEMKNLSKR